MNSQSLLTTLLAIIVSVSIQPSIASSTIELPKQFLLSDVKIQLERHCPWDNRRTYEVNGSGQFRFSQNSRSEDPNDEDYIRDMEGIADIEDVGYLLILLLESAFQYLPETIDHVSYSLSAGLVQEGRITISTACDARISLEIGYWTKTVNFVGENLLPIKFVRYFEEIVGEYES